MTKKLIKINTNLEITIMDFPNADWLQQHKAFCSIIGNDCGLYQIIAPKNLYEYFPVTNQATADQHAVVMLVDEEGLLKPNPQFNAFASWLYDTKAHGHPIAGNVLIVAEEFINDDYELAGLDEEEAKMLVSIMKKIIGNPQK